VIVRERLDLSKPVWIMGRLSPQCAFCRVERVSIALEPIAKRYDVRSLECPCCETVVRLVERRQGGRSSLMQDRRTLFSPRPH
jgi:hypothetical protein